MEIGLLTNIFLSRRCWEPFFWLLASLVLEKKFLSSFSLDALLLSPFPYPSPLPSPFSLTPFLFAPPLFPFPPSSFPSSPKPYPSRSTSAVITLFVLSSLRLCPTSPSPSAAWSLRWRPSLSILLVLIAPPYGNLLSSPLHALAFLLVFDMASAGSVMPIRSSSLLGHGSFDALSFLLQIISGVCEGSFYGFPWQDLPCIRSVVKERVALAAFSPCSCISLSVSTPAALN